MIKLFDFQLLGLLILLPVGLGFLIYIIPKVLGHPKIAKALTIIYGILILVLILSTVFSDYFFTKKDAKQLVEEQGLLLKDDFELVDNKSSWAIGDYFHTFSIQISIQDRIHAIENIKNSDDYRKLGEPIDDFLSPEFSRSVDSKQIQNYETEYSYVREYLKPNKKGYSPTFRRILISKKETLLTFQDIDE